MRAGGAWFSSVQIPAVGGCTYVHPGPARKHSRRPRLRLRPPWPAPGQRGGLIDEETASGACGR
jgi:hypothetical protein